MSTHITFLKHRFYSAKMDNYRFIRSLGKGHYGNVSLYQNNTTGNFEVIKHIPRSRVDSNIKAELINHVKLDHENVIRFKHVFVDGKNDDVCIVMEHADGGDMFDVISTSKTVDEDIGRAFFQQLIAAIDYCHSNTICHRDIKLENILVTANGQIKLCDFGFSFDFSSENPATCVGTPSYLAPEVMNKTPYDGEKVDVWGCGVVLYVMLYGFYPFDDAATRGNPLKMIRNITNPDYHVIFNDRDDVSQECQDLIRAMLERDPVKRISIAEIMNTAWFQHDFHANIDIVRPDYDLTTTPSSQSIDDVWSIINHVILCNVSGAQKPIRVGGEVLALGAR